MMDAEIVAAADAFVEVSHKLALAAVAKPGLLYAFIPAMAATNDAANAMHRLRVMLQPTKAAAGPSSD